MDNTTMPTSIAALPFDYQLIWAAGAGEELVLEMHALNELDSQSLRVDVGLN